MRKVKLPSLAFSLVEISRLFLKRFYIFHLLSTYFWPEQKYHHGWRIRYALTHHSKIFSNQEREKLGSLRRKMKSYFYMKWNAQESLCLLWHRIYMVKVYFRQQCMLRSYANGRLKTGPDHITTSCFWLGDLVSAYSYQSFSSQIKMLARSSFWTCLSLSAYLKNRIWTSQ